jgi:cytochrome c biogenesis protein CcdA
MLRLIALVVSIGLADSLNPTTIAPALYLAAGERSRSRTQVTEFTVGVFLVYFVGGVLIALGPGQLLLSLVPKPDHEDRYVLEIIVGAAMLVAAAGLWIHRDRLSGRQPPQVPTEGRSSAILGATITAVELPTAFPYFAAIAAIVGSGLDPARQVFLLVLFNVCFVVPLLGIAAVLWLAGDQADQVLLTWRTFLQRRWPVLLAGLALVAGIFIVLLGATGLGARGHGRLSHFIRHVRHLFQ